ncbi:MAG: FAD-dependent oxidoreductase, partial [Deltaproteobacteria bacterium]|nr:FAD-dependent oxidoreductase [Deltaproteobacteria bacterium]
QARVFREKQSIDLRTGHRVLSIDRTAKTISGRRESGEEFQIDYDKLLIATGASPIIPDLPGFDLPGVLTLKSLEHGRLIKAFIGGSQVRVAVIMGMGYIAMEMSEALRDLGIEVHMVKPRPDLLPWMHRDLTAMVQKELEENGVNLYLGHETKGVEQTTRGLKADFEGVGFNCQMVLVAIGVNPSSELAADAGLELGPRRSISTYRTTQTSDTDIYAAGDCADAYHVVTGEKTWIPLALRANRSGYAAADNVTRIKTELPGVAGTAVFKLFDLQIARTGLTVKEAEEFGFEPEEVCIEGRTRAFAHPGVSSMGVQIVGDKKSGRLLGMQIVARDGAAHRINAPAVALHTKMTVDEFSRTDMAYAPPFGPVWDPMLTAANQLLKKL